MKVWLSHVLVFGLFFYTMTNVSDYMNVSVLSYHPHSKSELKSMTSSPVATSFTQGSFNFQNTKSFKKTDLSRISELSKREFRSMILRSLPKKMRRRVIPYLNETLNMAAQFNIDPFWALAIMWTESHFNPNAESYVRAQGLMQIMPGTGRYIGHKLNMAVPRKGVVKFLRNPKNNIKMGTFYLNYLSKKFYGNIKLATVAYNMGPGFVRMRLRTNRPVGVKNLYLNKVTKHYKKLVKVYNEEMRSVPRPYELTYVAKHPKLTSLGDLVNLLPKKSETKQKTLLLAFSGKKNPLFF
ncbi:lytic transglycosylase domain-containing protein [Halobacteriovorax sp. GB3]|uniref:lytic transglycosylase domain-containing protein n=1 Tax=Halobacteriovorax sp. GB3 TaxID=2719615 RepID=UPI002361E88A|nr:lytic transglycosylase domain-containing protein [Halobacteriovorax sp. GB3]MDD0852382.1 lytic transglycosylase domain-containing protein [Halobacteriovorax sp. GB3]